MYIRQYQEVAARTKCLTQRILTPQHSIMGRFQGSGVVISFADPVTVVRTLPLEEEAPPLEVYEEGLEHAGLYHQTLNGNSRVTYYEGGIYTVMHKRGKPSVRRYPMSINRLTPQLICAPQTKEEAQEIDERGWLPLKIEVTRIRFGRLQAMTDEDVRAEGVSDRAAYIALWNSINGAKAWDLNPLVARIAFKLYEDDIPRTGVKTAPETMTGKVHIERRLL